MARKKRARFSPIKPKAKKPARLGGAPKKNAAPSSNGLALLAQQLAPKPQPLPIDPIYTEQLGQNNLGLSNTLTGIEYQRGQLGQEYGFNAAGGLDLSNPYNRATLLQRSYQQGQRGTTNSMAARGQLYAGATQRNLDEGTFQYGRNYDALRRQAAGAYHDLDVQSQQAQQAKLQDDLDAKSDYLSRASQTTPTPSQPTNAELAAFFGANKPKPKAKAPKRPKQKPNQQNYTPIKPRYRGPGRLG